MKILRKKSKEMKGCVSEQTIPLVSIQKKFFNEGESNLSEGPDLIAWVQHPR